MLGEIFMRKNSKMSRVIAFVLSLVMLLGILPLQVFADDGIKLKNGTAKITADMTVEQVKEAIFNALVENPQGKDPQSVEWEYGCTGYNGLLKNWAYGSIEGFSSKKLLTYYTHPAIKDIEDGNYNVRIAGTEEFVVLSKTTKTFAKTEIVLKENYGEVLLYLNDDLSTNFNRFREELFNTVYDAEKSVPGNLTFKDVTFEYDASRLSTIPIWHELEYVDTTDIQKSLDEGGNFKFRMIVPETADYYGTTVEFNAVVKNAPRIESEIKFTDATFTYTSDYDAMRENLLNSLIDWKSSTLPSLDAVGKEYYTIEYYAENLIAGKPAGTKKWVALEGGTYTALYYPPMAAGEQKVRISFKGNSTHTSVTAEKIITVNKAKTSVYVNSTSKYADEKLPKDFITTSSKDPFEIYAIYVGMTNSAVANFCIDLPDSITESFLIDLLNPIVKLVIGKSMDDIINNGITLEEINAVVNSQQIKDLIKAFNIDLGVIGTVLEVLDKLPSSLRQINISFSEPNRAGMYNVVALAINPNYETGVGVGVLYVKTRYRGTKLQYNQSIESRTLTVEQAKDFDFTATLSYQGIPVTDQSKVNYLYTGFKKNGMPYTSTTTPPREAGYYTQTAVVLGGNYMAVPKTRSFTIK